jgi:hypothetical protein
MAMMDRLPLLRTRSHESLVFGCATVCWLIFEGMMRAKRGEGQGKGSRVVRFLRRMRCRFSSADVSPRLYVKVCNGLPLQFSLTHSPSLQARKSTSRLRQQAHSLPNCLANR